MTQEQKSDSIEIVVNKINIVNSINTANSFENKFGFVLGNVAGFLSLCVMVGGGLFDKNPDYSKLPVIAKLDSTYTATINSIEGSYAKKDSITKTYFCTRDSLITAYRDSLKNN